MSDKANKFFRQNLEALRVSPYDHVARAKWSNGEVASKKSIYQVFEKYPKGQLPIHNLRETAIKSAIQEILWIYKDQSNKLENAHKRGIFWWDSFDVGDGTIGCRYGETVRKHKLMDRLLSGMLSDPFGQRHILNLWQNEDFEETKGLVPCAFLNNFSIVKGDENKHLLKQHLHIRSSDYVTAGAINRIQYYCWGLMICGHLNYHGIGDIEMDDFSVFTEDLHIYDRHEFAIEELLNLPQNRENWYISLPSVKDFYSYDISDFVIRKPSGLHKLSKELELAI